MVKKLILSMYMLLVMHSVYAQTNDEWYWGVPIVEFQFEGLINVDGNDIQGIVDSYIDSEFNEDILNDLIRRLYNLEFFDLVTPEAIPGNEERSELILRINFSERPIISEIQFVGNVQIRRGTLLDAIVLKEGDVPSQNQLISDRSQIVNLYIDRGFSQVSVEYELGDTNENNSQIIIFNIEEGIQTNVRSIQFSGIEFATPNQLLAVLETKQQGLFDSGIFQQTNLELDRQAILNFYGENGYIDAQVLNIETEEIASEETGRRFLEVTYFIDEGIPWLFGELSFSGNTIFTDEELRSRFFLQEGNVLNTSLFQQGFQAMSDLYYQGGYIFNQIDAEEERNEALQQVNYNISIIEAGRAYIENIIIRGNTKTSDAVILRELPFEEGDVFSATKIRSGIANLFNTQFFSNVPVIETPQGSVPGLMDLVINLEEGQTTDIRFGFTIGGGGDFPIAGILSWTDSNFLGNGQTISADISVSPDRQSIDFSFFDPWLFGDRWSGGIGLQFSRTVRMNRPQDLITPIFGNDSNLIRVPDPFQGYYVFSRNTEYKGSNYTAGQAVPDIPSEPEIRAHDLITDYSYYIQRGGTDSEILNDFNMEYVEWAITPSLNSGLRIPSIIGWFGIDAGISIGFNIVEYDENIYRPYSSVLRDNLRQLRLINSFVLGLSLDNRDVFFNPQNGYLIEQRFNFVGGLLGGSRSYIRSDTTLQAFLRVVDVEVSPEWSFKIILAANASFSFLLDQFFAYEGNSLFEPEGRYLRTNGMTIARGWPIQLNGQSLFNSWFEVRMPLSEQVLWFDLYFEAVRLTQNRDIFAPGSDNWLFGFGAGLRFTLQQFPFRLYLGKRFRIENGEVVWQAGSIFPDPSIPDSGLDLIFAISIPQFFQ